MAQTTSFPLGAGALLQAAGSALARPVVAAFGYLVSVGEAHPLMVALDRLGQTDDTTLAARGLTRVGEAQRILGPRCCI